MSEKVAGDVVRQIRIFHWCWVDDFEVIRFFQPAKSGKKLVSLGEGRFVTIVLVKEAVFLALDTDQLERFPAFFMKSEEDDLSNFRFIMRDMCNLT